MSRWPTAPDDFTDDQQKVWNKLVNELDKEDSKHPPGIWSDAFVVSGTVTASAILDLGAPEVTATAQTLALLLKVLQQGGLIKVILK